MATERTRLQDPGAPAVPAAPPAAAPSTGVLAATTAGQDALRAEHDALAGRLATRASVDQVQNGGVLAFFTVLAFGMTCKLAWDRWGWLPVNKPAPEGQYPLWFLLGTILTLALLSSAVRAFRRAAALRADEAAGFERLRALRSRLGLDT